MHTEAWHSREARALHGAHASAPLTLGSSPLLSHQAPHLPSPSPMDSLRVNRLVFWLLVFQMNSIQATFVGLPQSTRVNVRTLDEYESICLFMPPVYSPHIRDGLQKQNRARENVLSGGSSGQETKIGCTHSGPQMNRTWLPSCLGMVKKTLTLMSGV